MFTDGAGRIQPIWAFALSALLSGAAFLAVGYFAAAIAGDHILRFELIFRPLLAALLLAIYSWLLMVGNHVEEHQIAAQGLPLAPGWAGQFAVGCGVGLVLVLIAVIPIAIWGNLSVRVTTNALTAARVAGVLVILIAGALLEELMFRGYPFQRLVEGIGAAGAIAVFSVLFGVVHLSNPGASFWGLINTMAIGFLLSVTYLRTRGLWMPWGIHFAWNAMLGLIVGLPVSGMRLFNVAVHTSATGPKWLTGSSYGIEASAPGAVAILVGLIVVWKAPLRQLPLPAGMELLEDRPPEAEAPKVTN